MGVEYSRRNSLHNYEDGFVPHLMNNQQPLKFHSVRGENVRLLKNGAVASRYDGFCKGIVFSQRPVSVNEYIYVKFLDISNCWSGGLRIGFTSNDPASYKHKLPKYACPCMTDMPGNWARALAERFVQKDSVLFYYVNREGDVHYGLDNEERGIFFNGVNTSGKLWAMMDIYGNTIQIELLAGPQLLRNMKQRQYEVNDGNTSINNSINLTSLMDEINLVAMRFHCLHGKNVALKRERTVAVQNSGGDHGYVFTEHPMTVNKYFVMRVLSSGISSVGQLVIGLTSCNPLSLRSGDLPDCPDDLLDRPEYWVVNAVEESCTPDDILLFTISSDGALQYSKNGSQLCTVMFVDHTLDLWFFLNLNKTVTEIKLEGFCNEMQDHIILNFIQSFKQRNVHSQDSSLSAVSASERFSEDNCECVVCCETNSDSALYRCGHVCMCYSCASRLKESSNDALCPICREVIKDVIKLYK